MTSAAPAAAVRSIFSGGSFSESLVVRNEGFQKLPAESRNTLRKDPKMNLLSKSTKTEKALAEGSLNTILFLQPGPLCPKATPGCLIGCLGTAGLLALPDSRKARVRRYRFLIAEPQAFVEKLSHELTLFERRAIKAGLEPVARLDGLSDLDWSPIYELHPGIRFVEYTKRPDKMHSFLAGESPRNLHLTFSRSERNESECLDVLRAGGNVTVVFSTRKGDALPSTWNGYSVIDGDTHDLRHRDPRGVVVGLRAKGKARKDSTGFVVQVS